MQAASERRGESAALRSALAQIKRSVAEHAADLPKRIARKVLRGRSGQVEGPLVLPLTAARASDPNPAAGLERLEAKRDLLMRHASGQERSQYRAAMLCLRWRRRFEGRGVRLVVDNTKAAA